MSGYGKNQEQYVYDAAATRPNQVPSFTGIAQPSFASQYPDAPTRISHEPSNLEMPYIPTSTYESRGSSSYSTGSSFIDAQSRHPAPNPVSHPTSTPEITNVVSPSQGTAGSTLLLHIRTKSDISSDPLTFIFMFGQKRCHAAVQFVDQADEWYNYALTVQVPPFPDTKEYNPKMSLQLIMEDKQGQFLSKNEVGQFTFTDMSPSLQMKRKYSTEFGDDYSEPNKRAMRPIAKPRSSSTAYSAASVSPHPVHPSLSGVYGYSSGYDMGKQSQYTPQLAQSRLFAVPSGINVPQADMKPPHMSPGLPNYSQYSSLAGRSPATIAATPSRSSVAMSPPQGAAPVLVRATTLPHSSTGSSGQAFNPYAMYPSKAILKIDGDLDSMTEEWTQEEHDVKRRLVMFERSQSGSTITTSFAPVTAEARPARSICVSCILWEEKDECFITSVDTIYLLESLINVRFTVEEKNRIRRNLEGFRPLTVSKAKQDSEEFFKIIMGFPNPKPRNIEKDVKVFPWKILAHALKKIISKYTASYSSTAGAGNLPVVTSNSYLHTGLPQAVNDAHRNTSPRSIASTVASNVYTPSMHSTTMSPSMRASAGLDGSAGHAMPVSQRNPTGHGLSQWVTTTQPQGSIYATGLPPGGRGSYDYGGYLDTGAATGVPSAAQSTQMPRSDVAPDMSQMSTSDPYQQYGQRTTRV